MFTGIDHVMICVPDLARGMEQFRNLGFNIYAGGAHPGKGTHNAIALNEDDYVELLAIQDPTEVKASSAWSSASAPLPEFIAAGGGIRYIAIQSSDLEADVSAMRGRGVDVSDAMEGTRVAPSGVRLQWKLAVLGAANPLPIFFIEHVTHKDQRRKQVPTAGNHPNQVYTLERAYIVSDDAAAAAASYAKVLGMPQPAFVKGTVIMSDMAVFQIGTMGLGIVQPYARGPAADALKRRGPGPFQALYRTTSMGAAARWMEGHGIPPLPRGVRNTGEQAMLATPDIAGGAYIGFVGRE